MKSEKQIQNKLDMCKVKLNELKERRQNILTLTPILQRDAALDFVDGLIGETEAKARLLTWILK